MARGSATTPTVRPPIKSAISVRRATDRSSVARPQARGRFPLAGGRRRHPHYPADARPREHHADAALPEHHGRRAQERTGGELQQQRPTTSTRIRSLKSSARYQGVASVRASVTNRSQRGPRRLEKWLREREGDVGDRERHDRGRRVIRRLGSCSKPHGRLTANSRASGTTLSARQSRRAP
jgi:hypothetical protein